MCSSFFSYFFIFLDKSYTLSTIVRCIRYENLPDTSSSLVISFQSAFTEDVSVVILLTFVNVVTIKHNSTSFMALKHEEFDVVNT